MEDFAQRLRVLAEGWSCFPNTHVWYLKAVSGWGLCVGFLPPGAPTHRCSYSPPHLKSGTNNASVCDIGLWGWWDCVTPIKCEDEHVTLESLCVLATLPCLRSCFIVSEEQKTGLRLLITLRQYVSCTLMGKGMVTKRGVYYICSGSDIFVFLPKLSQSCPLHGKGGQLWS